MAMAVVVGLVGIAMGGMGGKKLKVKEGKLRNIVTKSPKSQGS